MSSLCVYRICANYEFSTVYFQTDSAFDEKFPKPFFSGEPIGSVWRSWPGGLHDPALPRGDFFPVLPGAIGVHGSGLKIVGDVLSRCGELLPLQLNDASESYVFNCTCVATGALDNERSVRRVLAGKWLMEPTTYVFHPAIVSKLAIFRIPQQINSLFCVSGGAPDRDFKRLIDLRALQGLRFIQVWTDGIAVVQSGGSTMVKGDDDRARTETTMNERQLSETWRAASLRYVSAINDFVARGRRDGWETAGDPPRDDRAPLASAVLDVVRRANVTQDFEALRTAFPPAWEPFLPQLKTNGQNLEPMQWIDDSRLALHVGSTYQTGSVVVVSDRDVRVQEGVLNFGRSPCGTYCVWVTASRLEVRKAGQVPLFGTLPGGLMKSLKMGCAHRRQRRAGRRVSSLRFQMAARWC